jgi:hypothetical protein
MAGDFWLTRKTRWVVNSSLYHWALEFLILSLNDQELVQELAEIRDTNIGLVNLEDFDAKAQRKILELLRDNLVDDAMARLPADLPSRESFTGGLQELADLASCSLASAP